MILDHFIATGKAKKVKIYKKTQAIVSGVQQPFTWAEEKTVDGLFWKGQMRQFIINNKLTPDVTGIVMCRTQDVQEIDWNLCSKLEVGGKEYSVIFSDDIALQNKVTSIPVKAFL